MLAAGLAANLAPALLRSYEEENRLLLEQQLYDKYMAMGMGPQHIGDDEQEVFIAPPPSPPHGPPKSLEPLLFRTFGLVCVIRPGHSTPPLPNPVSLMLNIVYVKSMLGTIFWLAALLWQMLHRSCNDMR